MDVWTQIVPWVLLLARISAFFMLLPIFGWQMLPVVVRAGLTLVVTAFYGLSGQLPVVAANAELAALGLVVVQEVLTGLAIALAANLVFLAVQQTGKLISQEMGFAEAGIIDPVSGEESDVMELFLEMTFVILFLAAGGHHLLLAILGRSYEAFPVGALPDMQRLTELVVQAGSDMLVFALRLAAPMLAAFLVLTVALAVLSRAMPEINILYMSFPLRIGLGVFMAAAMLPTLSYFTSELAQWMGQFLSS